jgi:heat shock protein HtpX
MNLYTNVRQNISKTYLLLFVFVLFFGVFGYIISYYFKNNAFLYIAIIYAIVSSFIGYWFSDRVILSMSKAKLVEQDDNQELYHLVENLCIASGLPMPKIYIINDESPNAFATGRNPKNAIICVTSGLLKMLNKTELEGVIAHELSHIKNYDILIASLVVVLASAITLISNMILRSSGWSNKARGEDKNGYIALISLIALVGFAILSPIVATLIQLAVSRKREFLADSSSALLTRYPEGLISALEKISNYPKPMTKVNNYTRNLYISDPAKQKVTWFNKMFLTHPPVSERIQALNQIDINTKIS